LTINAVYPEAVRAGTYPNITVPAANIASGKLADGVKFSTANADVTGTPSETTYLRGDGSWSTPAGGAGGGVTISTFTFDLSGGGGDVYIASNTYTSVIGARRLVQGTSWYITGMMAYCTYTSSVAATTFNVAYSTSTDQFTPWTYISGSNISVAANAKNSGWTDVFKQVNPGESIALHVCTVPTSGLLPAEFGVIVRYWRRLDE